MNSTHALRITALFLLTCLFLAGCGKPPPSTGTTSAATTSPVTTTAPAPGANTTASAGDVTIFAAASLADVLGVAKTDLDKKKRYKLSLNLASSGTLAQQIENGAEADLFFSASVEWADALAKKKLVARRYDAIGNTLVLIVPADSKLEIHQLSDLTKPEVKRVALADSKSAPAGKYARKALEAAKLWEQVQPKVAAGDDVRQVLLFVERGEADAGLVYATDAAASKKVRPVAKVDETLTGPIRYSLMLLKKAERNPAAALTFKILSSPESAKMFRENGFQVESKSPQK